jgi:hypothetical protein
MAYIIRESFEDKFIKTEVHFDDSRDALDNFFKTTKAFPGAIQKASWKSGNVIPPESVPKRLRITKGKQIFDWLTVRGGGTLVSSAFKDAVEEIEPGRHQFFPVSVVDKADVARPESYFIFNIVGRIDSIIEEKSNLEPLGRGQINAWTYEQAKGPWRCALDAAIIGGRACWIEHRYGGRWFVSDRLAALLQQGQLCGFALSEHSDEIPR